MDDYQTLKKFWDDSFQSLKPEKIAGKWVLDEGFNRVIESSLTQDSKVLDFGCGSGWGLLELYFTQPFTYGLGIDQSAQVIRCDQEVAQLSSLDHLHFMVGDESNLSQFPACFDFILSINTIDVVPDEVAEKIAMNLSQSLAKDGTCLIGINPSFTAEEMTNLLKMTAKDHYYYRDNILRCNYKTIDQWLAFLKFYFKEVTSIKVALIEQEKKYPRTMFICKK